MHRNEWINFGAQLARPVLQAIGKGQLRATMPVEQHGASDRRPFSHLEAVGRLLTGLSPWLGSDCPSDERRELAPLAIAAIEQGTDSRSPDFFNFSGAGQPLVDTAFLCQAILRAPKLLWEPLSQATKDRVIACVTSTRAIMPGTNNWLLFSAVVETFLAFAGHRWDCMRVDYAIRQHEQWYKGDGVYGDGQYFHWDYYNSFVIHPMLLDTLKHISKHDDRWSKAFGPVMLTRAQRYAAVQERMIGPDGSFPPVGRSLAYRAGAFHLLAQLALEHNLPAALRPARVRRALTLTLRRTLNAPGTFDDGGWLSCGLCGHQPGLAEAYISTGSLYLTSAALLPLGLPPSAPFWIDADEPTTAEMAWSGMDVHADKSIA